MVKKYIGSVQGIKNYIYNNVGNGNKISAFCFAISFISINFVYMNKRVLYIILSILLVTCPVWGQRNKRTTVHRAAPVETETAADRLYATMLPATAKVMFIDSMVVDKASFLSQIPLNKESGRILSYQQFFNSNKKTTMPVSVYVNEFGDQAYYAEEDTINGNVLYRLDWLGDKWGERNYVDGIDESFTAINYPFVMSDGITLFFAAKGDKSVGGYDIFTTTFDSESGKFYQPQNYGLPFNSKANDYFLAIDEYDNLGWLVSDRHQPEGKVCIYTFEPQESRVSFEGENLTTAQLAAYANISSISNTWKFGNRANAMARLQELLNRLKDKQADDVFDFVINDQVTYHHLSDFRNKENRQQYLTLNGQKASLRKMYDELAVMRETYHKATESLKANLKNSILRKEQEVYQLQHAIANMEKQIRNTENHLINK